ncbi:MAG: cell division protein ZapB [Solidesulfovibrio sp.]
MDIFDTLEARVEQLVARKKALEEENATLRADLMRLEQEKQAVTTKIDGLLDKLRLELEP